MVVGAGVQGKLQHPAPAKAHGAFSEGQPGGAAGSALWEEGAARGQLSHPGRPAWLRGAAARFRHAGRSQEACLVCAAPRLALLPAAAVYHYCYNSWRADPGAVWVWKAVESARLIGRSQGRQALAATLAARTQGPIGGLKIALAWAALELRGTILWSHAEGPCILEATRHQQRSFVLQAIRRHDLSKAGARKEQQGLQQGADVDECRRLLKRLPTQGLQEAARAVATGDVVTRSQSRFWQGHDGTCHCGGKKQSSASSGNALLLGSPEIAWGGSCQY